MATTLTKTGWLGLTTGKWLSALPNTVQDLVDGIKIPSGLPPGAIPGVTLNSISPAGNKFLKLVGDSSSSKRAPYYEDANLPRANTFSGQFMPGIHNQGVLIVGAAGCSITGTGGAGVANTLAMVFGNGNNSITGIGKVSASSLARLAYTSGRASAVGIVNHGLMQFGNGSNTLKGSGFSKSYPPAGPYPALLGRVLPPPPAIFNEGSIIFGSGSNTVDALAGGFAGSGFIEFGSGKNTIKGFGDVAIDGGGNASTALLFGEGTYQITAQDPGSFLISNTGRDEAMDITGVAKVGSAIGLAAPVKLAQGTITIDKNGKAIFESGTGSNAFMVYDATTHTAANSFINYQAGVYDPYAAQYPLVLNEVRFASAIAGQTLQLFAADTGVGSVVIGTGTSATAVSTATTNLNINASQVKQDLVLRGNRGNNSIMGGAGDDRFIADAGNDTFDGGGGLNIVDYSLNPNGIALTIAASMSVAKGVGMGTDTLRSVNGVIGTAKVDVITGNAAGNQITGGLGVDVLDGANGDDTYFFNSAAEHAAAEIRDTGVFDVDTVVFNATVAGSTLTLFAGDTGIEEVTLGVYSGPLSFYGDGLKPKPSPRPGTTGRGVVDLNVNASAVLSNLKITGNDGANSIVGCSYENVIDAGDGDDTIRGGADDDTIIGGLGIDDLDGGGGNDTYVISNSSEHATAEIHDSGDNGVDVVVFGPEGSGYGLGGDFLTLFAEDRGIEEVVLGEYAAGVDATAVGNGLKITGSYTDDLIKGSNFGCDLLGEDGDDTIQGGDGDDTITGGRGLDMLTGGAGHDEFRFNIPTSFYTTPLGLDVITDFASGDVLRCPPSYDEYGQIDWRSWEPSPGGGYVLSSAAFLARSTDSELGSDRREERFLYNTTTGIFSCLLYNSPVAIFELRSSQLGEGLLHPLLVAADIQMLMASPG